MDVNSREKTLSTLQQGAYGDQGEVLEWSYYDTAVIAAATLRHRMFTSPVGVGGKTLADTNMTQGGQIPQAQKFEASVLKVMYTSSAAKATADLQSLYDLLSESTLEVVVGQTKNMGQWTLQELMGNALQFSLTPTVAGDNISQPQSRSTGIYLMNIELILPALTNFELVLTHHEAPAAGLANDKLKISLAGILARAS